MNSSRFTLSFLGAEYPVWYITEPDHAIEVLQSFLNSKKPLYGLDVETAALPKYKSYPQAALSPHLSRIRLVQVFNGKAVAVFDMMKLNGALGASNATPYFQEFFKTKKFVGHNSIFDMKFVMADFGVTRMDFGCTYIMWKIIAHATRPDDSGLRASLQVLSEKILKAPIRKELQVSDWSEPELTYEQIEYAALDPICTYLLAEKLAPVVERLGCHKYYRLCKAAQIPIAKMELNGIGFDAETHIKLIDKWTEELYAARQQVLRITGGTSVTSHTIALYLTEKLNSDVLAVWPRTDEGKLMVDAHTLMDFANIDPVVAPFADFQKKEKLTTSFGIKLQSLINPETRRIHASYNICGARTGRLSCSNPNLQQLPRDTKVRSLFRSSNGPSGVHSKADGSKLCLLCADYSQIELRCGAELSRDSKMLAAYRAGQDLHTLTASIVGHKKLEEVTKEDRQRAKAFNFGLMFGLGPRKFKKYAKHSYGVEVTQWEAEESIKKWRETYAGYREWQLQQPELAVKNGMVVRTPIGKLRMLSSENSYGGSMNTPVQGGACECMLAALIGLQYDIDEGGFKSRLCNCVHDELIVECPESEVDVMKVLIEENMRNGFRYVFPEGITRGICEVGEGLTWGEAKS